MQTYTDLTEAKLANVGSVLIWHSTEMHFHDRKLWLAEKNGDVIDYAQKDDLIMEALAKKETVIVLKLHRDGRVSAQQCVQLTPRHAAKNPTGNKARRN